MKTERLSFCTLHSAFCISAGDWQVSAGDLSESLGPGLFILAALASVWVFHDARRREGFGARPAWAWALLALLFPPAVLPLYLAARLYTRRAAAAGPAAEAAGGEDKEDVGEAGEGGVGEAGEDEGGGDGGGEAGSDSGGGEGVAPPAGEAGARGPATPGFGPTLLYAAVLVLAGGLYFYADYRSFEARLARAEWAKVRHRPEAAVAEYRAALRVREDGRARKLLGLELLQLGRHEEALAELLAAARAGEPQESLDLHLASAYQALGRRDEAAAAYRRFLSGPACAKTLGEVPCEAARARAAAADAAGRGAR